MAKLVYEQTTCTRCGGSGSYSYCQTYGTRCVKCAGSGKAATKRGAKAAVAVKAFMAEQFSVPVETLVAGDRIKYDGKVVTIAAITRDGGRSGHSVNGEMVWTDTVTVTFTSPVPSQFGAFSALGTAEGTLLQRAVTGADWDRVVAFARGLKGVTVVEADKAGVAALVAK